MGSILKAICPCGFEKEDIYYGGGMMNFTTHCGVPAINQKTGQFLTENYFNKDKLPEEIVFYDDPKMYIGKLEQYRGIHWGDVYLKHKDNLCPVCRSYSLSFTETGLFD